MTKHITLTQGSFAIVDDEDFDRLSKWTWRSVKRGRNVYAARPKPGVRGGIIYMHREIITAQRVDHVNRNGLDNRRSNLREADASLNAANARLQRNNTSGFRGVRKHNSGGWCAEIKINKEQHYLGYFPSRILAALAYDLAAIEAFGDFAFQNIRCLNPEQCGGYGSKHCHACLKARDGATVAA